MGSRLTSATNSTFDTWDSTSGSTTDTMSGPFHSGMEAPGGRTLGNMALMPLRQTVKNAGRGFAPETQDDDIVDEVIRLFKPNILFKSFEMKDSVDRVLVYITLYIVECLKKLAKIEGKEKALLEMFSMALGAHSIPGESGFPLNAFFTKPQGKEEEDMKKYIVQLRHETGQDLLRRSMTPPSPSRGSQASGGSAGPRESSSTSPSTKSFKFIFRNFLKIHLKKVFRNFFPCLPRQKVLSFFRYFFHLFLNKKF